MSSTNRFVEVLTPEVEKPLTRPATRRRTLARFWPVTNSAKDIAPLDGLRAIAVLLTLGPHLIWSMIDNNITTPAVHEALINSRDKWDVGIVGVLLFFVLSGFLLFIPYARHIYGLQSFPSTRKFYMRRALRILPAYWVAIVVLVLFLKPAYQDPSKWYDVGLHFFMLHNFSFDTFKTLNLPFWTMAVESQYYVLLPLFALGLVALGRAGRFRSLALALAGMAAISPLCVILWSLVRQRLPGLFQYFSILSVFQFLCAFVTGIACCLFYIAVTETNRVKMAPEKMRRLCQVAGLAGLALSITSVTVGSVWPSFKLMADPFTSLGFGGVVLGTLFGWNSWKQFFSIPLVRFVGIISYSLYMWNLPLFEFFVVPFAGSVVKSDLGIFLIGLALIPLFIIPMAFLSYHFVERPFIKVRQKQH